MNTTKDQGLRKDIVKYLTVLHEVSDKMPEQKKDRLNDLALYISSKLKSKTWVRMLFVSPTDHSLGQLGQIWAKAISVHNRLTGLEAYSAGITRQKINPMALNAIGNYGFEIKKARNRDKTAYNIKYADNMPAIKLSSKTIKHPENPESGYVALVINLNEREMPAIPGADLRMPLNYETLPGEKEEEKYERICRQIGADMMFIFSNLDKAG